MKNIVLASLVITAVTASVARAQSTENFYFSFQANGPYGAKDLVTGEIFGLTNNAASNPSSVEIFSDEGSGAGTQESIGTGLTSDLTLTLHPNNTGSEKITVTNNQITALNPSAGIYSNTEEWTSGGTTPAEQLGLDIVDNNGSFYFGSNDLIESGPVSFSLTPLSTPEPSAWALGLTAVALLGVLRRRALTA
jgi:MYXO-CTERM domain-containing protein